MLDMKSYASEMYAKKYQFWRVITSALDCHKSDELLLVAALPSAAHVRRKRLELRLFFRTQSCCRD